MQEDQMIEDAPMMGPEAPEQIDPSMFRPDFSEPNLDPRDPATNTYTMVKTRFEKKCFKVCYPFQFGVILKNGTTFFIKYPSLAPYFSDLAYFRPATEYKPASWLPFIQAWLKDHTMRIYLGVVVDPTRALSENFNMWKGFLAETLPPVPEADVAELVQPIINHLHLVITNKIQAHTDWMVKWFANHVKRPEKKTAVVIVAFGKDGAGKDIIPCFHRTCVLGKDHSYQTANLDHDVFSKHADGHVNRVFLQADEVSCHTHEMRERLKDLVTCETLNYEPKFAGRMALNNLINMYMTTNHENAMTPSPTDRRFVMFRCYNGLLGNKEYFDKLGEHLERPEVARAWYQHLMAQDLSQFKHSFQSSRPLTEYYKEAQYASIPGVSRFLSAVVNLQFLDQEEDHSGQNLVVKDSYVEVSAKLFYQKYQSFHTAGNYKCLQTQTSFGREVKRVNGVSKQKTRVGYNYALDLTKIKQHLVDANEYDDDAAI